MLALFCTFIFSYTSANVIEIYQDLARVTVKSRLSHFMDPSKFVVFFYFSI